jgi:hypothetical protein
MDTETLIKVVALIDARIDKINKDRKAIDASGYSVLSKKLSFERLEGATAVLELLSNDLQKIIDADVASMETSRESGE